MDLSGKIRETFEKVAKEGIGRLGIVQEILMKSTDFVRRIMGWKESLCRMFAHIATVFTLEGYTWYPRDTETATTERRSIATGGVRLVEVNKNGERPTGYWQRSSV